MFSLGVWGHHQGSLYSLYTDCLKGQVIVRPGEKVSDDGEHSCPCLVSQGLMSTLWSVMPPYILGQGHTCVYSRMHSSACSRPDAYFCPEGKGLVMVEPPCTTWG